MTKRLRWLLFLALIIPSLPRLAAQSHDRPPTFQVVETFDLGPNGSFPSPQGINSKGTVVGYYEDGSDNNTSKGFVRTRTGAVTTLVYPTPNLGTYAQDINSRSLVCGYYVDAPAGSAVHGFFYTNGTYGSFDAPGAENTHVLGLNDGGDYVGTYGLPASNFLAFIDLGGVFTTLNLGFTTTDAQATGISSNGLVAGIYLTAADPLVHGFTRGADGTITTGLDYPGAQSPGTNCTGINARGWVVGFFGRRTGYRGFLFQPPNQFVDYVYPGAVSTFFGGINDQGLITGDYTDSSGQAHGFKVQAVQ